MIYQLTPEQEAQLEVYAEKWRKIGLSTEPADRSEVSLRVQEFYTNNRRSIPEIIEWFDSPDAMKVYAFEHVIWNFRRKNWIWVNIERQLERHVYHKVRWDIRQYFRNYLRHSIIQDFAILVYQDTTFWRDNYGYGFHDYASLATIDYIKNCLEVDLKANSSDIFMHITTNCGWWLPYKSTCCLCDRPSNIFLDSEQRPHSANGHAIQFRDGWGVYAWHGVRVPEYVIMRPQDITPDKIMEMSNREVARVMIERYGKDKFIRNGGFSKVQSDDYGDLYRIKFKTGDEPIVAVHVQDASTDRDYFLYVPPHIRTAHEGVT